MERHYDNITYEKQEEDVQKRGWKREREREWESSIEKDVRIK